MSELRSQARPIVATKPVDRSKSLGPDQNVVLSYCQRRARRHLLSGEEGLRGTAGIRTINRVIHGADGARWQTERFGIGLASLE